jgi:hypothetical protein
MTGIKIGGACKWLDAEGVTVPDTNFRVITIRRLLTMTAKERQQRRKLDACGL